MNKAGPEMTPVTRTYNTLMIACNVSGQWQEALSVYEEMLGAGHVPNTTTYNALICAYSRSGKHKKVRRQHHGWYECAPP
jgi:pentatricopeptide repeat domain-containing protein 1